jgi:hypothetical protein
MQCPAFWRVREGWRRSRRGSDMCYTGRAYQGAFATSTITSLRRINGNENGEL